MIKNPSFILFGLVMAASCTDIGSFATEPGECYRGNVVDAQFVMSGFTTGTELYLTLDTAALSEGKGDAGLLWTSDERFETVPISQIEQLANDSLSEFQFPGGRIKNYMVHAVVSDGAPATVVISLMENEQVEVRVLRPQITLLGDQKTPIVLEHLFGVFRLKFDPECNAPFFE